MDVSLVRLWREAASHERFRLVAERTCHSDGLRSPLTSTGPRKICEAFAKTTMSEPVATKQLPSDVVVECRAYLAQRWLTTPSCNATRIDMFVVPF